MTMKYLDTLEYVRKAKEIIDPEALAESQVKKIESAIETAVQYVRSDVIQIKEEINNKEFATKGDIQLLRSEMATKVEVQLLRKDVETMDKTIRADIKKDMADLRFDMVKWIVSTGIAVTATLGSMLGAILAHLFHWF